MPVIAYQPVLAFLLRCDIYRTPSNKDVFLSIDTLLLSFCLKNKKRSVFNIVALDMHPRYLGPVKK